MPFFSILLVYLYLQEEKSVRLFLHERVNFVLAIFNAIKYVYFVIHEIKELFSLNAELIYNFLRKLKYLILHSDKIIFKLQTYNGMNLKTRLNIISNHFILHIFLFCFILMKVNYLYFSCFFRMFL